MSHEMGSIKDVYKAGGISDILPISIGQTNKLLQPWIFIEERHTKRGISISLPLFLQTDLMVSLQNFKIEY